MLPPSFAWLNGLKVIFLVLLPDGTCTCMGLGNADNFSNLAIS